jgi:hypothetical protein
MHARVLSVLKLFCGFRVLLALGLTLQALPARADNFYAATPTRAAQAPGTLLKAQPIALPPLFRAQAWRILYTKRDYAGRRLVASDIVVASTVQAATGRPQNIIVWAHPTCWRCLWLRPPAAPNAVAIHPWREGTDWCWQDYGGNGLSGARHTGAHWLSHRQGPSLCGAGTGARNSAPAPAKSVAGPCHLWLFTGEPRCAICGPRSAQLDAEICA